MTVFMPSDIALEELGFRTKILVGLPRARSNAMVSMVMRIWLIGFLNILSIDVQSIYICSGRVTFFISNRIS